MHTDKRSLARPERRYACYAPVEPIENAQTQKPPYPAAFSHEPQKLLFWLRHMQFISGLSDSKAAALADKTLKAADT